MMTLNGILSTTFIAGLNTMTRSTPVDRMLLASWGQPRRGGIRGALAAMLLVFGAVVVGGWFYGGGDLETLKDQADKIISNQTAPSSSEPIAVAAADAQDAASADAQPAGAENNNAAGNAPAKAAGAATKGITAEQTKLLDQIRGLMAGRDLDGSQAKLAEAEKMTGSDEFKGQVERLKLVQNYLKQYWDSVWKGAQRVGMKDSIDFNGKILGVVEFNAQTSTLILRVDGVNRQYTINSMTRTVSLICASHALDVSSATNKMIVAVFLTMDGKGDREQARKYFEEAKQAGLGKDVDYLLPELGIESTALANSKLTVPKILNRLQRTQLMPNNWLVRYSKNGKYQRGPLGNLGTQARVEGWLQITYAGGEEVGEIQIVNRQRVSGNFTARFILDGVSEGQKLGLYTAAATNASCTLDLPMGTAHVEFVRKDGKFECNINGEPASVTVTEGADPKMPAFLGFSCQPGSSSTLAYFEFKR